MKTLKDICEGRMSSILTIEDIFKKEPTTAAAILLRDLWKNWKNEDWGRHLDLPPTARKVEYRIKKYSKYIKENPY